MNDFPACILCTSSDTELYHERPDPHLSTRIYLSCAKCGLIFLSPECRLDSSAEKERYDSHQNNPEDAGYVKFLNRLCDPLSGRLKPGGRGLDFGCGPGPTVKAIFEERGFEVANYDPLYFPDQSLLNKKYDFITCTEVAEHLYQPRREFKRLNTLLCDDGGQLGIMTQFYEDSIEFSKWWYALDPTHVCFYGRQTFKWIAEWMNWSVDFPAENIAIFSKQQIAEIKG